MYRIQLAISENPHREDPMQLWKELSEEDEQSFVYQKEADFSALDQLKKQLSNDSAIKLK